METDDYDLLDSLALLYLQIVSFFKTFLPLEFDLLKFLRLLLLLEKEIKT